VDNYDSFTHNLARYIREISAGPVHIVPNDRLDFRTIDAYETIVLSPGPGLPAQAGQMPELLRRFVHTKKILGVCLGHQAVAEVFGAKLCRLSRVFHGIGTPMQVVHPDELFRDLPGTLTVGRYHSWVVAPGSLPEVLRITAVDDNGHIMALAHRDLPVRSVQFHPESVLTPQGRVIIRNFLEKVPARAGKGRE